MRREFRYAAVIALTLPAACGKPLGEYQVRNVYVVAADAEPEHRAEKPETQMLRVEFTSKTSLYDASDGGGEGLYVIASFCPYDERRKLYIGEPYYDDRSRYGPARVLERKVLLDGKVIEKIASNDRRPRKNPVTSDYTYTTYLALERAGESERPGWPEQLAYDLRRQPRDLCLRIDHPGYFITPSRSQVFTVPSAKIQSALLRHARA